MNIIHKVRKNNIVDIERFLLCYFFYIDFNSGQGSETNRKRA